jgi:hypothetical protein
VCRSGCRAGPLPLVLVSEPDLASTLGCKEDEKCLEGTRDGGRWEAELDGLALDCGEELPVSREPEVARGIQRDWEWLLK